MVKFIYGRSGSGKTEWLFETAEKAVSEGRHVYFLVPDREAVNTERAAAKRLLGADTDIITFKRLCDFVFRRYGGVCRTYIDAGAKKILMRRALTSLSPTLSVYGGISDSDTNIVNELVSLRTEMKHGKISASALMEASGKLSESKRLCEKLSDIALICSEYDALVSEKYSDPDSALSEAGDKLRGSDFFFGCDVFIDSFAFLSAEQYEIVSEIFRSAENVYVSMAYDPDYDSALTPFYDINEANRRLHALAYKNNCTVLPDTVLREAPRFAAPELSYLALNLWHDEGVSPKYMEKCPALRVFSAADKTAEADFVACDIAKKIREGARYRDFAIILRHGADYAGIIDAMLRKYEIPYFFSVRSDIARLSPVRFVFAALDICRRGFTLENVLSYIKTGIPDTDEESLCLFETYITRWNIYGARFTDGADWTMNPDGYGEIFNEDSLSKLEKINTTKKLIISPLLRYRAEQNKKQSVREHCRVLFEFLSYMRLPERANAVCDILLHAGEAGTAAELSQAYGVICDMLDSLVACSGDICVGADAFAFMLKMMAQGKDVGNIPTSTDEVLITEAGAGNSENAKYAYIIGAAEGIFPAAVHEDCFFSEHEKRQLSETGIEISTKAENRIATELYFFYSAVCSASCGITISYPRSCGGEATVKCAPLRRILEMFPEVTEKRFDDIPVCELIERRLPAMEYAARLGGNLGKALRGYFLSDESCANKLRYIDEPLTARNTKLSEKCTSELFPEKVNISYTRLEKYIRCNFSYFCDYELKINDCSKIKFGSLDIGNFMHKMLEKGVRYAVSSGERDESKIDGYIHACAKEYLAKTMGGDEAVTGNLRHVADRLCESARVFVTDAAKEFDESGFHPVDYEIKIDIGAENIAPVKLEDENGRVRLSGKIDRVDMYEDEEGKLYVRIADYKTGSKTFDMEKIRRGFDLQMLLYLFSVCENGDKKYGKKPIPAGVLYVCIKSPNKKAALGEEESDDFIPAKSGILINDEKILRKMENNLAGRFIPITEKNLASGKGLLSAEEFDALEDDVKSTVLSFAAKLRSGEANALPETDADTDPCAYCKNRAVCRTANKKKNFAK